MMTKVPVTRPNAATVIAALYSTWAGAWCPQGLKLHSNLKVFSFLILPPPTDRTISGSTCKQGRCKHGPLMAAWLAMSRFVSVGYTPQTTDICVCCQHVDNVDPTHWQHSVKLDFFLLLVSCQGRLLPTQPLCKEEEDLTLWLTHAFLVLPKTTARKKLGSLRPILHPLFFSLSYAAYFASTQIFYHLTLYISYKHHS